MYGSTGRTLFTRSFPENSQQQRSNRTIYSSHHHSTRNFSTICQLTASVFQKRQSFHNSRRERGLLIFTANHGPDQLRSHDLNIVIAIDRNLSTACGCTPSVLLQWNRLALGPTTNNMILKAIVRRSTPGAESILSSGLTPIGKKRVHISAERSSSNFRQL